MEQVFFRLHVRFVTTVTRLLSIKTRRLLEYVTLGNAFCLAISLGWLHSRFVNPKGEDSAASCLPNALQRAGVDPAKLHVLQIHVRMPPDDRGGGVSRRRKDPRDPGGGLSSRGAQDSNGSQDGSSRLQDLTGPSVSPEGARAASVCDAAGGGRPGSDGSSNACTGAAVSDGTVGNGCSSSSSSSSLPSELLPPEMFYSMKLVSGKDAVGTLSGPGTLGIDRRSHEEEACDDGNDALGGGAGSGGGGEELGCKEGGTDKRSAVQSLVDMLPWGKTPSGQDSRAESSGGLGSHRSEAEKIDETHQLWELAGGVLGGSPSMCRATWSSDASGAAADQPRARLQNGNQESDGGAGVGGSDSEYVLDEVYLYSLEKGFLMLRPDLRRRHGIITANVTVDAHDPCLGGSAVQTMVKDFVGYDTVVMNWLISLYGGRGFLYGVHNSELFNLNYAAEFLESTEDAGKFLVFKVGVMFTTLFLFFTTTTLVSFTLRETQERMLKFTFLLQHHVRHRLPYAPLIFTHVVESLVFVPIMVGILFFLFEFFSDQLLAFMVLSVVWLCEVYSVVSVRTTMSIRFFPQVFFLYFTLFHVYFFSFPFGFSYLALVTTVLFLQHSMLFFWNRYEVPALRAGTVSSSRPRQAGMVIGVIPRYDPQGMGLLVVPVHEGRQRAATVDIQRESRPATWGARQPITRSNSSPGSSSPAIGSTRRRILPSVVANVSVASVPNEASASTTPGSEFTQTRMMAPPEWASARVPGGGVEVSRGNMSAPLLGSFPFSLWNHLQASRSARIDGSGQDVFGRHSTRIDGGGTVGDHNIHVSAGASGRDSGLPGDVGRRGPDTRGGMEPEGSPATNGSSGRFTADEFAATRALSGGAPPDGGITGPASPRSIGRPAGAAYARVRRALSASEAVTAAAEWAFRERHGGIEATAGGAEGVLDRSGDRYGVIDPPMRVSDGSTASDRREDEGSQEPDVVRQDAHLGLGGPPHCGTYGHEGGEGEGRRACEER